MTPRLKLPIMLALVCGLLLALAPSGAYAAKGMEVAVQDDSAMVIEIPKPGYREKGLKLTEGLSASWIRANVQWSYVVGRAAKKKKAPKNIAYNWTGYDALVDSAAA